MKKSLTKLLIIGIICLVVTYLLSILSTKINFVFTNEVQQTVEEMNGVPGSGAYLIFGGAMAITADLALAFAHAIMLGIAFFMLFIIIILQIIARLVQIGDEKKWKNTTSKTLTTISVALQILLCIYLLFIMISNFMINKILFALVLALNITTVVLFIKELKKMKKLNTDTGIKAEVIEEK